MSKPIEVRDILITCPDCKEHVSIARGDLYNNPGGFIMVSTSCDWCGTSIQGHLVDKPDEEEEKT
jgi:hypothetical protein